MSIPTLNIYTSTELRMIAILFYKSYNTNDVCRILGFSLVEDIEGIPSF